MNYATYFSTLRFKINIFRSDDLRCLVLYAIVELMRKETYLGEASVNYCSDFMLQKSGWKLVVV